ncbi:MAG: stage III sporulation protein AG [Lachnospiraceae bacterium]|nr:stage III sporulation protein AG [Lachnospiraceae bacterium]
MKEKLLKKENMVVFVLLGILLLVIAIPLDTGKEKQNINEEIKSDGDEADGLTDKGSAFTDESMEYCLALEARIEELLSVMDGVGKVQAMVTVSASREMIVEKDEPVNRATVTEADGSGGSRSTNESSYEYETIFETDSEGNKTPYVVKQIEPEIQGITVVAQGGGNAIVQKNISDVLEALFHIEAHKIKVVKMK